MGSLEGCPSLSDHAENGRFFKPSLVFFAIGVIYLTIFSMSTSITANCSPGGCNLLEAGFALGGIWLLTSNIIFSIVVSGKERPRWWHFIFTPIVALPLFWILIVSLAAIETGTAG